MSIFINHPLFLGHQIFRMNRGVVTPVRGRPGQTTFVPRPGFWQAKECEAVECPHYNFGWVTLVDPATELGQQQSHYIRKQSGRSFREERHGTEGSLIRFTFEPGQKCFQTHTRPVDRDPLFLTLAPGKETKRMDYDEFFDTFNETTVQREQKQKEV